MLGPLLKYEIKNLKKLNKLQNYPINIIERNKTIRKKVRYRKNRTCLSGISSNFSPGDCIWFTKSSAATPEQDKTFFFWTDSAGTDERTDDGGKPDISALLLACKIFTVETGKWGLYAKICLKYPIWTEKQV